MGKTFSDLQSLTGTYLDEATAADWTTAERNYAINFAYHDVIGHVMEVSENWYQDVSVTPFSYAIIANQQEYTIDSTIIKPTRVEINYQPTTSGSQPARAIPIKMDEVRGNLGNTNNSAGSFFSVGYYLRGQIGNQKIGFIPVPQIADTTGKSISVWGTVLPGDLVNGTDNVNIPYADRFSYLIPLRAAGELMRKGQQDENSARGYIQEYENGIIVMQNFLKDRVEDDMNVIVDSLVEKLDMSTLPLV